MESIALHIEYLLLRNECVIMPGFGAFIVAESPARYDTSTKRWIPMMREIRFNGQLINDDGLLTNSYARKYRIPFQEARVLLNSHIKEMKATLDLEGEITLGGIGIITKTSDGRIVFQPFHTARELSNALGRQEVSFLKPQLEEATVSTESESELTQTEERIFDTERNYYIPVNKMFAKIAAIVMIMVTVGCALLIPSDRNSLENQANVLPLDTFIPAKHEVKVEKKVAKQTVEPTSTAKKLNIEPQNDAEYAYHLVIATFTSIDEAERYMKRKQNENLNMIKTSTRIRISAKSSNNRAELVSLLNSSKFRQSYPDAWIWNK